MKVRVKPEIAICSLCGSPLTIDDEAIECSEGHVFDFTGWGKKMARMLRGLRKWRQRAHVAKPLSAVPPRERDSTVHKRPSSAARVLATSKPRVSVREIDDEINRKADELMRLGVPIETALDRARAQIHARYGLV